MTNEILKMPNELQTTEASQLSGLALSDFHEGLAMMEAGQGPEAVTALSRCVEQAPTLVAGHLWLGMAHAVTCSVYPAIDHLQRATELAPDNFGAHYTLAKFYFILRVPAKGYESAQRALECARTSQERIGLSQLIQRERERERNGIARPLFNRKFGLGVGLVGLSGVAAFIAAIVVHIR